MTRVIVITAKWDRQTDVSLATSVDVPGLVVEAETWPAMIAEVRDGLPERLALNNQPGPEPGRPSKDRLG